MTESVISVDASLKGGRILPAAVRQVLGDLRGKIDGDLLALGYSFDGHVLSVEEGGVFRRWDPESGRQIDADVLSDMESCWAFSPDGRWVAAGGSAISLWDLVDQPNLTGVMDCAWVEALEFSPDGKFLASGHADDTVCIWEVETGKRLHLLEGHTNKISALGFSSDGLFLASAGEDRLVIVWGWEEGVALRTLTGHTDHIDAIAWSPSGHRLATASWDTAVRIWNPKTGELLAMLNGQGDYVHTVRFLSPLPTDALLVSGDSEHIVRVWDFDRLQVRAELRRHRGAVKHLTVSPDSLRMATGGADRSILFWDLRTGAPAIDAASPLTEVEMTAVSVDGTLAAVHAEGRLSLWDFKSGKQMPVRDVRDVRAVACSAQGKWAIGSADGRISIAPTLGEAPATSWRSDDSPIRRLAFDASGHQLVSSHWADGTLRVWSAESGQLMIVVPEATLGCTIESLAFHPTQPILAVAGIDWIEGRPTDPEISIADWESRTPSAGARVVHSRLPFNPDGAIVLWDCRDWKVLHVLEGGARRIVFHPNGRFLASVTLDDSILLWDYATGELLFDLANHELAVKDVAFDPSGRYLVGGGADGGLRTWDCTTWNLLSTIDLETQIRSVAFTPDGGSVLTGNSNSTCYVVDLGSLLAN